MNVINLDDYREDPIEVNTRRRVNNMISLLMAVNELSKQREAEDEGGDGV